MGARLQAIHPGLANLHALPRREGRGIQPRLQPQPVEQGAEADGRQFRVEVRPAALLRQLPQHADQQRPVLAIGMVVDPPDRFDAAHRTPERQPGVEQLRIEQLGGEGCLEERREPRAGAARRGVDGTAEQAHDASGDRQVGLGHQRVLAIVVVIDQAHRYPGLGADLAHRGALEAMPLQAGQGRLDQQRLALLWLQTGKAHFLVHPFAAPARRPRPPAGSPDDRRLRGARLTGWPRR